MKADAEERLSRARSAQERWVAMPFQQRVRLLKRLRHLLLSHAKELLDVAQHELGKPELDTLSGDLMVTLEQMLYYEQNAENLLRPRTAAGSKLFFRGTRTQEIYEPHGIVLVIAPWNYPVQLSMIPVITALYAGNAVVCKCSEYAPQAAALLQRIVQQAGFPEDLVQFSWEPPAEAALLLEARPDFVFFTGSSTTGKKIAERAGQLLIPSAMELGGKDAAVVFASCNFDRAINGLVYGAFSNAGQVCVSAKRIYVEATLFDRFVAAFEAKARSLRPGQDVGPLRIAPLRQRLETQLAEAQAKGASITSPDQTDATPRIVLNLPPDASLLQEESFGPVTYIAPFSTEAEALSLANSSEFGLSASVWTADMQQAERFAKAVRAGSCVINDILRNVSHPGAAFGGVGASGYGRYHGPEGLRTFSRIKTIMVVSDKSSSQINWFPFTNKTRTQLLALLQFRHGEGSLGKRAAAMLQAMRRADS